MEVVTNDERATKNYHQTCAAGSSWRESPPAEAFWPTTFTVLLRSRLSHIRNRQMLFVGKL